MSEPIKQKRVTVYIPERDYKQLRLKLIEIGISVSEWFRQKIKKEISK